MEKIQTLLYLTKDERNTLKEAFGGYSSGAQKCIAFTAKNITLFKEQEAQRTVNLRNMVTAPDDTYTCSCCDTLSHSKDCMFWKWDKKGQTAVGICLTCDALLNGEYETVSEYLRDKDKGFKKGRK